jgi:Flp pilus assembly protein TadG
MRKFRLFARERRATAAVELALVSTFFLLPLLLGGADFVGIILGQAQVNTALQALYYFALTNPSSANNSTYTQNLIGAINGASVFQLTLPTTLPSGKSNSSFTYVCYPTSNASNGATPTFTSPSSTSCLATGKTQITFVNYKVNTAVILPIPLPSIGDVFNLSASGAIQTASTSE